MDILKSLRTFSPFFPKSLDRDLSIGGVKFCVRILVDFIWIFEISGYLKTYYTVQLMSSYRISICAITKLMQFVGLDKNWNTVFLKLRGVSHSKNYFFLLQTLHTFRHENNDNSIISQSRNNCCCRFHFKHFGTDPSDCSKPY